MNPLLTFILALVRHGLTAVGATVVANGYADSAAWEMVSGGVIAAISIAWSMMDKKKLLGR